MNISLITTVIGTIAAFLGIYVVETSGQKLLASAVAILAIWLGYLSGEHEITGSFGRTGDSELASGTIAITGVGHWPQSLEFTIRLEDEERVVAERLRLDTQRRTDQRRIEGKLVGLELLSVNPDGFVIRIANETGSWIQTTFLVKYSLLNDWANKIRALC